MTGIRYCTELGTLVFIPTARDVQYNVKRDFIPLGLIWQSPLVLVVNPKRGLKTVADFIAYAKANPSNFTVASAGLGTNTHMASELFKREAGIDLLHVPYRSTGAALPDLLSGQVDATISDVALMAPLVEQGSLIALAVTAPARALCCQRYRRWRKQAWQGSAPKTGMASLVTSRTPPQQVTQLKTALAEAVKAPAFNKALPSRVRCSMTSARMLSPR